MITSNNTNQIIIKVADTNQFNTLFKFDTISCIVLMLAEMYKA